MAITVIKYIISTYIFIKLTTLKFTVFINGSSLFELLFWLFVPAGNSLRLDLVLVFIQTISYIAKALSLRLRLTANMIDGLLFKFLSAFISKLLIRELVILFIGGLVILLIGGLVILLISFVPSAFIIGDFTPQEIICLSCIPLIGVSGYCSNTNFLNRNYSYKRITNAKRNSFSISPEIHNILIGLLLGDLYIDKQAINARLKFEQGLINESYLLHLYNLFKDYCGTSPKHNNRKPKPQTGNINNTVYFNTYSLPCFNYYHDLFYFNKVKIVPLNIGSY